jgi:asparaginyl-tRNA synthetase
MFPLIKELINSPADGREIIVRGWVRTKREMKNLVFVELNDGSCLRNIQCTFDTASISDNAVLKALAELGTGASVEIKAKLIPSPASGQAVEAAASALSILGPAPAES